MFKKIFVVLTVLCGLLYADVGFNIYKSQYDFNEIKAAILKASAKSGYVVSDDHDLVKAYQIQFGNTNFDIYYNLTVYQPETIAKIAITDEKIAAISPFTILIYRYKGSKDSYYGFLNPKTIHNSTKISNENLKIFANSQAKLEKELLKELPKSKPVKFDYSSHFSKSNDLFYSVDFEVAKNDDLQKRKDEIYKQLESDLEVEGFRINNYTDMLTEFNQKNIKSDFELFETYSICKLKVIYAASKERPEVGVFAPCNMFFVKRKNSNKLSVGFTTTQNWAEIANIKDKEALEVMKSAENVVRNSLESNK